MHSDTPRYDIVISGGSYVGLALARAMSCALGPRAKILLVEKSAPKSSSGQASPRAFALSHASVQMLDVLGVWPLVKDDAQPVTSIEITDSSLDAGIRPVVLRYANTTGDHEPASHIIPDASLADALRTMVEETDNVEIRAPACIDTVVHETGCSSIRLDDGHEFRTKLLVAAEGRNSKIRDAAGIKLITKAYAQTGIVTRITHAKPHNATAVQHFLPGGPFAILPMLGNTSCITWTEDTALASEILQADEHTFLENIDKRIGGRLGAIDSATPPQSWPLSAHLARSYIADRLALVGDTARSVHPIAGQGLNLGLRDAAALTESIADTWRLGLDIGHLTDGGSGLARYQRWRRFDSVSSAAAFDGINRLFANDNTVLRSIRTAGLGIVDRLPPLKRFFVDEAAGHTGNTPRLLKGEAV